MKKIKANITLMDGAGLHLPGTPVVLSDDEAASLVGRGFAEYVDELPAAPAAVVNDKVVELVEDVSVGDIVEIPGIDGQLKVTEVEADGTAHAEPIPGLVDAAPAVSAPAAPKSGKKKG